MWVAHSLTYSNTLTCNPNIVLANAIMHISNCHKCCLKMSRQPAAFSVDTSTIGLAIVWLLHIVPV